MNIVKLIATLGLCVVICGKSIAQEKNIKSEFCSKIKHVVKFIVDKKDHNPDANDSVGPSKKKSLYPGFKYGLSEIKVYESHLKLPNEADGEFVKNDGRWTFICSLGKSKKTEKAALTKNAQSIRKQIISCVNISEWEINEEANKAPGTILYMSNKKTDAQITITIITKEEKCILQLMLTKS